MRSRHLNANVIEFMATISVIHRSMALFVMSCYLQTDVMNGIKHDELKKNNQQEGTESHRLCFVLGFRSSAKTRLAVFRNPVYLSDSMW